jgi:hypothetical protein
MPSSGLWRRVALVRTDVSEERVASIFRVDRISELETAFAITSRLKHNDPYLLYEKTKSMDL